MVYVLGVSGISTDPLSSSPMIIVFMAGIIKRMDKSGLSFSSRKKVRDFDFFGKRGTL
jgi:hypothetical protein